MLAFSIPLVHTTVPFQDGKIKFLGRIVDWRGIQADPKKTSAIQKLPEPNNYSRAMASDRHRK